jgi:cytochrome b subunit of formate dehydrogenase
MKQPIQKRWHWVMIFVGAVYLVAGIVFSALAGSASSHQMRVIWRFAAWVISAAAFAGHIWYEQFRLRSSPVTTASHAALAAALGAFFLAAAANIHGLASGWDHRPLLHLALVVWPVLTAAPAFVVALALAALLALRRSGE